MQGTTFDGWRTLAEPTYATSRYGRTVQFPAGTALRITARNTLRLGVGTVAARAGSPFETEASPRSHEGACWYVTEGALRFEGDPEPKATWADVETFMLNQPQAMPADPLGPVPGSGQARAKARRRRS